MTSLARAFGAKAREDSLSSRDSSDLDFFGARARGLLKVSRVHPRAKARKRWKSLGTLSQKVRIGRTLEKLYESPM